MYLEGLSFVSTRTPAASGNWQAWNGGLFLAISKPTPGHRAGYWGCHCQKEKCSMSSVTRLRNMPYRDSQNLEAGLPLKTILRCPLLAKIHITGSAKGGLF